jgi:hypothetical protein
VFHTPEDPTKKNLEQKLSYPICPSCGSTDFRVDGYVGYVQPYDAKAGEYGLSDMIYEEDIATGARCAACDGDVTELFKKFEVLTFYNLNLTKK